MVRLVTGHATPAVRLHQPSTTLANPRACVSYSLLVISRASGVVQIAEALIELAQADFGVPVELPPKVPLADHPSGTFTKRSAR